MATAPPPPAPASSYATSDSHRSSNLLFLGPVPLTFLLAILLLACSSTLHVAAVTGTSIHDPPKKPPHLSFYLHNKVLNLTTGVKNIDSFNSVFSVQPTGYPNPWSFGVLATFEDPLTRLSSNSSEPVGIGQGFYMFDSKTSFVLFQAFTATINTTQYQGSVQIFGQIRESLPKRVLSVIGGTGDFFLARGLATCELVHLYSGPGAAFWTLHFDLDLYY